MRNHGRIIGGLAAIITAAFLMTAAVSVPEGGFSGMPGESLPYFCETMSADELSAYRGLRATAQNCGKSLNVNLPLTSELWTVLTETADNRDPLCFNIKSIETVAGEGGFTLSFTYYYNKKSYDKAVLTAETAANEIIESFFEGDSERAKLLKIYQSLREAAVYDEEAEYAANFYGVFGAGAAGQEGFAEAFAFVCGKAGIKNVINRGAYPDGAVLVYNRVTLDDGRSYNICVPADDLFMKSDSVIENILAEN
jgi:hypothetical protein